MSVEIKLNTAAMNALFPEGSEARLNLQQAVIANFMATLLKRDVPLLVRHEAQPYLKMQVDACKEAVQEHFAANWNYQQFSMKETSALRAAVLLQAKNALLELVKEAADDAIKSGTEKLQTHVQKQIDQGISDLVAAEVRSRIEAQLQAIREQL